MPLDALQDRIARTASALREARTLVLAGGAMIDHGFVTRATKDIDLSTEIDDQEATQVAAALRQSRRDQGLSPVTATGHRLTTGPSPFHPATGTECTVEVFPDGRRLHRVQHRQRGQSVSACPR